MNAGMGRLGLFVVGAGVGAAMVIGPGNATADGFDWNNYAISIDGYTLYSVGTAQAYSGMGDVAIADGDHAIANASGGQFDTAFAQGTYAGSLVGGGDFDTAYALGENANAAAGGAGPELSNDDVAIAVGLNTAAESGAISAGDVGSNDTAIDFDPAGTAGGLAWAGNGDYDYASVFGDNSIAVSGADFFNSNAVGSFDLAEVFGNHLFAFDAGGANWLVDILPSLSLG